MEEENKYLPPDVAHEIAKWCRPKDQALLNLVCKSFQNNSPILTNLKDFYRKLPPKINFFEDNSADDYVNYQLICNSSFKFDNIDFRIKVVLRNYHGKISLEGIKIYDDENVFRQIVNTSILAQDEDGIIENRFYWMLDSEDYIETETETKTENNTEIIQFYHSRKSGSTWFTNIHESNLLFYIIVNQLTKIDNINYHLDNSDIVQNMWDRNTEIFKEKIEEELNNQSGGKMRRKLRLNI